MAAATGSGSGARPRPKRAVNKSISADPDQWGDLIRTADIIGDTVSGTIRRCLKIGMPKIEEEHAVKARRSEHGRFQLQTGGSPGQTRSRPELAAELINNSWHEASILSRRAEEHSGKCLDALRDRTGAEHWHLYEAERDAAATIRAARLGAEAARIIRDDQSRFADSGDWQDQIDSMVGDLKMFRRRAERARSEAVGAMDDAKTKDPAKMAFYREVQNSLAEAEEAGGTPEEEPAQVITDYNLRIWVGDVSRSCKAETFEEKFQHGVPRDVEISARLIKPSDAGGLDHTMFQSLVGTLQRGRKGSRLTIARDLTGGGPNSIVRRIEQRGELRETPSVEQLTRDRVAIGVKMHAVETTRGMVTHVKNE